MLNAETTPLAQQGADMWAAHVDAHSQWLLGAAILGIDGDVAEHAVPDVMADDLRRVHAGFGRDSAPER
ncbi:MAG: hypothetical protein Q7T97_14255 [Burkholderiaceae bacterium]|nr:hypothetical protein [Burkholderiaceae bacterium]